MIADDVSGAGAHTSGAQTVRAQKACAQASCYALSRLVELKPRGAVRHWWRFLEVEEYTQP